jgi:20S proteasome subunit beta 3
MQSILAHNGAAVLAMVGKDCVAIATDMRLGIGNQTIATDFPKVFRVNQRTFVGLPGLATDMQTFYEKLMFRANLYKLQEERDIKPSVLANLCSSMLYERRFGPWYVEPVIAGLEPNGKPFIAAMDLIGASLFAEDFVLAGTCTESMYGMAETLYKPNMEPEELFEVISQCLLAAVDRDAISGWGVTVHVLTKDKLITRTLKGRQD